LVLTAGALGSPLYAAVAVFSLLALVLIHELGHAFIAHRLRLEVTAVYFSLIHGRCEYEAPDSEWEAALVAWGGVAAQLVVAIPVLLLDSLWRGDWAVLSPVVLILGYWSLFIAIYNLVPLPGTDGQLAWRVVPMLTQQWRSHRAAGAALRRISGKR
jgi:Zn-dependent protease